MHIPSVQHLAYCERGDSSDGDGANDQDTSHISETSSNSTGSRDLSQSLPDLFLPGDSATEVSLHVSGHETAGDDISDILPLSGGILARWIVNPVPLGIKCLSQLNTQVLLDLTARPSQGHTILKRSAPIGGETCDETSPKRRCTTYDLNVFQLTNEGRKHPVHKDVTHLEDPESK